MTQKLANNRITYYNITDVNVTEYTYSRKQQLKNKHITKIYGRYTMLQPISRFSQNC